MSDLILVNRANLRQTCSACPAQWEGTADDGRIIYVRFRHGSFTAGIGKTLDDAVGASYIKFTTKGELICAVNTDGDGNMTTAEMEDLLKGKVEFYGC